MDFTWSAKKRYLVLENGKVFEGFAFGAEAAAVGEVVFATNMSGFTETVTDPGYEGQIVVQTFPLIGNTGVNPAHFESNVSRGAVVKGYIVREWCQSPSHFTCMGTLDTFFMESGVPGLWGIDTRALTKLLRSEGALRGALTDDPAGVDMEALKAYDIGDAVSRVSVTEPAQYPAENAQYKVALWDFGMKSSTIKSLNRRGCDVTAVPYHWTAEQVLALQPDGVLLSNGPGDPAQYQGIADEVKKLLDTDIAVFGCGLGHQLLAMANGGATEKLPYGHRGGCSVKDLGAGRTLITHQNHGYAVAMDALPRGAKASYVNADDGTCEGLDYEGFNGFSVQFSPEACWTPHGEGDLFDRFVSIMKKGRDA